MKHDSIERLQQKLALILRTPVITIITCAVILAGAAQIAGQEVPSKMTYPDTPKRPITDTYFGINVTENYRWLDNPTDPEVKNWVDEENKLTRSVFDAYPGRQAIAEHLKGLYSSESSSYYSLITRGGILFGMKNQPPKEQPFIVALASADDTTDEQVIVDPNRLDPSGGTSIDFYVPSLDGRFVAVSLSKGGSEDGTIHIFEVASGSQLPDTIAHVNYPTGGGSVAWNADNTGLYYTRYPAEGERPAGEIHFYQEVYYHKLGTPVSSDRYAIGKEFPRIAEIQLQTSEDGKYMMATVANGDGGEFAHYVLNPSGKWIQITRFADKITEATFGRDQALYLLSHNGSPRRKILRMPLTELELTKTKTVVPETDGVIESFLPTVNNLCVIDMVGGPSRLRVVDQASGKQEIISTAPISSVRGLTWIGGDEILFNEESYLKPQAWFHYDPAARKPVKTALSMKSKVNFDDAEVVREFAVSKDGTKIPINVIKLKGTKLDGQNPTILYGYGGYGINMTPEFSAFRRVWLDQGGVYAIVNLRGGGEFGEDWHQAGRLTKKQNVFDDFVASAKFLVDTKYTSPSKLVAMGGSNGGLLMGAELVQHPEMFRIVVSYVGIYDMLRVELWPNGEFNTTEFGSVKNKDQFEALYAYSPYHHVVDGTPYPAILFLTGENDGRVDPANSRKMTARLQAATGSDRPILLRQSSTSGHGIGTAYSERIEEDADVFSFMFSQLGIQYKVPTQ